MKLIITYVFLLSFHIVFAQNLEDNDQIIKLTYHEYRDGKKVQGSEFTMKHFNQVAYFSKSNSKFLYYQDFRIKQNVDIINYEEVLYKALKSFDSLPKPSLNDNKERILDYECKYASFTSFSNKIEVWYTEEAKAKGSPYRSYIPNENSLVLKIVVNGDYTLLADSIEKLANQEIIYYPLDKAKEVSSSEFAELSIKSKYITLSVFDEETINFDYDIRVPDMKNLQTDYTYHFSKGTIILKKIRLPKINKSGSQVFAKLTSWSNGDAYDRTGTVFIIPNSNNNEISMLNALQDSIEVLPVYKDNSGNEYQGIVMEENYMPPIEIMRFFTSFGVRHFNKLRVINNYPWKEAVVYKQDVTALIPDNQDEIWIGVFIGNYDKGGHKVSLELNFYPAFEEREQFVKWIKPIFNTVNIMEMSGQNYGKLFKNDTLKVIFKLPENINNPKLLYTTTGHGGWGNGDEFNPKLNQIFIDGKQIFKVVPWRTDCATYRFCNPASGNFSNGISSSDLSRSNWCPATLTPPYFIPLNNIIKGKHILEVVIDQGDDEGNSFNHWSISGVIVGDILISE